MAGITLTELYAVALTSSAIGNVVGFARHRDLAQFANATATADLSSIYLRGRIGGRHERTSWPTCPGIGTGRPVCVKQKKARAAVRSDLSGVAHNKVVNRQQPRPSG